MTLADAPCAPTRAVDRVFCKPILHQHSCVRHPVQHLSPEGRNAVTDIASRYNISPEAVEHMLIAVNNGSGRMAQFNCPELGGSGQWMRGGMTMVGDMFNHGLKATVDNLCNELSNLLASTQVFPEASAGTPGSSQWWPTDLGTPFSSGSQNNTRYAVFAGRLAVENNGRVTVYDTLDHRIGGVSQQQGGSSSLTFNSQYGTVMVNTLPVVSGDGIRPPLEANFAATSAQGPAVSHAAVTGPAATGTVHTEATDPVTSETASATPEQAPEPAQMKVSESGNEIIALIEKLAQLHSAGVLSDEEFSAKKLELLARL